MPVGITRTIETRPVTGSGLITDVSGLALHMLLGVAFYASSEAVVRIRNGNGGDIFITIHLIGGESMEESYSLNNYYRMPDGIYVEVVSGAVVGSIRGRV